jgi:hypothetical protein
MQLTAQLLGAIYHTTTSGNLVLTAWHFLFGAAPGPDGNNKCHFHPVLTCLVASVRLPASDQIGRNVYNTQGS